jgi:phosphoglycerate dehydrogenase-like enzyme
VEDFMQKKVKVLSVLRLSGEELETLRAVSPILEVSQVTARTPEETLPLLAEPEVLYTFQVPFAPEQAPHLKWIQLSSAGADHLLGTPIMNSDIAITTASGIHAVPIAEYIFGSTLAFLRRVPLTFSYQQQHVWPQQRWTQFRGGELRDSTIGIIGYGSIGREVGRLAKAFGMTVLASKRSPERQERDAYRVPGTGDPDMQCVDGVFLPDRLEEMVARCDVVVVTLPLTPQTERLVSESVLRAMKRTAYFVNISRGEVVDEGALIRALKEGWIAGAGLDVFDQEPLSSDSQFYNMPNVILTPHIAGMTTVYNERATDLFAQNLQRYLAGKCLLNLVDKQRGY